MSPTWASLPGRSDTPNQDLLLTAPGVLVLLDGAGGPSEDGGGCRLASWPEAVARLNGDGPATLLDAVRAAEHSDPRGRRWPRLKPHDDATAAHWTDPAGGLSAHPLPARVPHERTGPASAGGPSAAGCVGDAPPRLR
ncbi:hypothetical protein [Kitasatospora sp. NPDC088346]|uniref:hypothetical protein n=1 Tax=Kitasatospora sp. NPDC088346 TaxID=3364073 RepID=UPI0037F1B3FD